MSISHDVSINLNIDIYKEHRKISKKIREIHRLSIKGSKLSIDELNKKNRLPELELYLREIRLNNYKLPEAVLSEIINTNPLKVNTSMNNRCISMSTSVDNRQIDRDIINLKKNI